MTETTYEEAKRCPKCEQPGQEIGTKPMRGGGHIKTIICHNSRCNWHDTTWIVQVNADGSIPEPTLDREKSFPKIPDRTESTQAQLERLYQQTIAGGETH